MKNVFILLVLIIISCNTAFSQGSITIEGVSYSVDTIVPRHDVGLGSMHTYYRLPDMPLQVSVLEVDVSNPYLQIESCLSYDTLRGIEPTSKMAERKSKPGNYILGAINGDFYTTSGVDKGLSLGGQLVNGQVARAPHSTRYNVAFNSNNAMFLDVMSMDGNVTIGLQSYSVNGVNQSRGADNLILYNSYGGKSTDTNPYGVEIVIEPVNGSWEVNEAVVCKVLEKHDGVGNHLLEEGKAVLSGHGLAADFIRKAIVGNELTLNLNVRLNSSVGLPDKLSNSIGGDRIILSQGQIQENNWPEKHPRSAIGKSVDGKKIILMVVEGRSTESIGVSTKQLAELMRYSGASEAFNLDGGGSSTLVVRGDVANVTSDGYERSVANALLFKSTAPQAEAVTMKLNAEYISVPFGQTRQIKASTYNDYGDVVDYLNASNVTYRVEGNIGTIDQNGLFRATGSAGQGMIIAEWGYVTDTIYVKLKGIESINFEYGSLTIDHLNTYRFKVYGTDNANVQIELDNNLIGFRSLNPSVGTVDADGVFKGISDGTVTIEVYTLDNALSAACQVNVEIAKGTVLVDDFKNPAEWQVTSAWLDLVTLERGNWLSQNEEVLKVSYEMTYQNRTASITLSKMFPLYSMPDSLMIIAAGNGINSSMLLNLDHQSGSCFIPRFTGGDMIEHKARIAVENIEQMDYPLSFSSIILKVERSSQYVFGQKYTGAFYVKGLYATYPDKTVSTTVTDLVSLNEKFVIRPNPVDDQFVIESKKIRQDAKLELYNLNGQLQKRWDLDFSFLNCTTIKVGDMPAGVYVYRIVTKDKIESGKIIIR